MGKFEGTPGPWEVIEHNDELMVIQAGSLDREFGWSSYTPIASELQGSPDANLISAAPDLLETLQGLLIRIADDEEYGPYHAITKARQAIAKALGE